MTSDEIDENIANMDDALSDPKAEGNGRLTNAAHCLLNAAEALRQERDDLAAEIAALRESQEQFRIWVSEQMWASKRVYDESPKRLQRTRDAWNSYLLMLGVHQEYERRVTARESAPSRDPVTPQESEP